MTSRKIISATAFVFTLSFSFMACNSSDTSGNASAQNGNGTGTPVSSGDTASLHGAYMAHCYPVQVNGNTVGYANREINFLNETQFTDSVGTYVVTDTLCEHTESNETSVSGTYTVSGNDIDFNYGSFTVYQIYSMPDANTIEFGDIAGTHNGTTAALRSTAISPIPYTLEVPVTATPTPAATPAPVATPASTR